MIKVGSNSDYTELIKRVSKKYNFEYDIVDPYENETDICFMHMDNTMIDYKTFEYRISKFKGNPKIVSCTAESASNGDHMIPNKINTLSFYQQDRYTLSHNIDDRQNCYSGYILCTDWERTNINKDINIKKNKTKFCNFITSDCSIERELYFNYISENYKIVDSYGKKYHNTPKQFYTDNELDDIIPSYKFSLVVENELSFDNEIYLTEKIIRAFNWGTIPIYWGSKNANKIINEKAFINITGLSPKEALNIIKKYDEDDDLYYKMLNEPIFINRQEFYINNIDKFIYNIISNNKEIEIIKQTYNIGILGFDNKFIKNILINNHYKFNIIKNLSQFKNCDLIICNNLNICKKLNNENKLKVLYICYNNDYNCDIIDKELFTISDKDYNIHNLYIPYEFFSYKDINKFNLYCNYNEYINEIKSNNFNYYEYYRKIIIYFIVDIIKNNISRKINYDY